MAKSPKSLPIQAVFIQKLKEALPPNVGLAEEMADALDISTDSAYRRIRGETDLSIDETFTLAKKYAISVDSVFSHHNDTVTFTYTKLIDSAENFERYLSRLCNHLKSITTFDLKQVCYMAEELPIFYSMFTDKLAEFKLFYWQRSVLNIPEYQGRKFEYGLIPERQLAIAREMLAVYKTVPSMEIWTNETILTATKQVEYYYDSGVVSRDISIELLGEIRNMVLYVQDCAEKGRKSKNQPEDSYTLYNSDVVLGTNCIYVKTGDAQYAYVSFNTLNSLTTNNREFCEETEHWVKNIEKKSTLISGVAEKQRFQFFHKMLKHIDSSIERVQQN